MHTVLVFPFPDSGKRRHIVRHVRRDPEFATQHYFVTTEEKGCRLWLSFEQATGIVTWRVFLERDIATPLASLQCAIDEKTQSMYLVYNTGTKHQVAFERFRLKFEKPDDFGFRHVSVTTNVPRKLFSFKEDNKVGVSVTAINILPSTARLVLLCKYSAKKKNVCRDPQVGFVPCRLDNVMGPLEAPMLSALQSKEMELRNQVFSRSNDLLTLISYHSRYPPADAVDAEFRDKIRNVLPDGFMILSSYNAQLRLINTLQIEPVQLLNIFLCEALLNCLKAGAPDLMPDFMYFGTHLQLLGNVHKYVVFFFHDQYVLAAKWPKNWYKQQQLPQVQQKRVICLHKHNKRRYPVQDVWCQSTDLYFRFYGGVEFIRKISLGQMFKDYRFCAFCGEQEKRKRKNKAGKRVSSFKVCRLCKELNHHKRYTEAGLGCHYCSFECVRRHWKQHKVLHGCTSLSGA